MERNGMNLFRVEKIKVNEEEKFVIVCGKYRASKAEFKAKEYRDWETDRKSTRLNSSHSAKSRMPSSA